MAEWSKALRSGRSIFVCVGSNPTECKKIYYYYYYYYYYYHNARSRI